MNEKPVSQGKPLLQKEHYGKRMIAGRILGVKSSVLVAAVLCLVIAFPIVCYVFGGNIGKAVGVAVGSFKAVTEDIPAAYNQGKEDGLDADDTSTSINKIRIVGKLEVLAANAKIVDLHEVGEKYKALYEIPTDIIFTVDLTQMKAYADADGYGAMIVECPEPEARIEVDAENVKKLDDWQRILFNGSTEDGMKAYTNTLKRISQHAEEELEDYGRLKEEAKNSAEKQIRMLIDSLDGSAKNVKIMFVQKGGEDHV